MLSQNHLSAFRIPDIRLYAGTTILSTFFPLYSTNIITALKSCTLLLERIVEGWISLYRHMFVRRFYERNLDGLGFRVPLLWLLLLRIHFTRMRILQFAFSCAGKSLKNNSDIGEPFNSAFFHIQIRFTMWLVFYFPSLKKANGCIILENIALYYPIVKVG